MELETETMVAEETLEPQGELVVETDSVIVEEPEILAELVIEEVSIDGMCGVY